jgi:hypothetical protein
LAKQAHLILEEAGSKQLVESKGVVEKALARQFPDMIFKSFTYEADHPEEVTYHLGQVVKFLVREANGSNLEPEELTEEQRTFKQQVGEFWKTAKPELKKLAEEIWFSKDDLRRRREGKPTEGRISTGSVRIHEREKAPA